MTLERRNQIGIVVSQEADYDTSFGQRLKIARGRVVIQGTQCRVELENVLLEDWPTGTTVDIELRPKNDST